MSWDSDARGILFAHSKTSTTGDLAGHIRHVSANPLHPMLWTVLSLGLFSTIIGPLFDGNNQYDRFREILHGVLMEDNISALGIELKNMNVHSIRKVTATYWRSDLVAQQQASALQPFALVLDDP